MRRVIKLGNLKEGSFKGLKVCAVIGFFDGVHRGHQEIIKKCVDRARQAGGISIVFTFNKQPKNIIHKKLFKKLITSSAEKLELIKRLGVDYIVIANFDELFSGYEPEIFCSRILVEKLNIKEIFIGQGFRFGKDAKGNVDFLKSYFKDTDVKVNEEPIFAVDKMPVSSTLIRNYYGCGDIGMIEMLLGRHPSLKGKVVHGDGRGRTLGFPTSNIDVFEKYVTPMDGVYAGSVKIFADSAGKREKTADAVDTEKKYPAVINIGDNPTFTAAHKWIESYLLDFDADIYGRKIEITFLKRLRDEKKFAGKEDLIAQIAADIDSTRNYFKVHDISGADLNCNRQTVVIN
ncbi:MAG TPA: bifunctional riboflavin kinase/FAD synthetase [Candidatus Humimicrobiaceae bacterium]